MIRASALSILVTLAAASCAGTEGRIVHSVSIESPEDVDASDAADVLANHPPKGIIFKKKANYQPLALEIDRQRIETWFHTHGYFAATVQDYDIAEGEEGVDILFRVNAGALAKLEKVQVSGAPAGEKVDQAALEKIARLKLGEAVVYEDFEKAKDRMVATLANAGYALAKIDAKLEVERATGRAIAHYYVDSGPVTYFGKVDVKGNSELPDSFVLNRIAWKEGERYDPKEIEQTRARLFESGLVADVRFSRDSKDPKEIVDMTVHTARGKQHEIRVGAGIGLAPEYYEFRLRAAYVHKSFFDPLLTLRVEARPSYAIFRSGSDVAGFNWEAATELEREDLFFPRLLGSIGAEYRMLRLEGYTETGPTGRINFSRRFADDRLILGIGFNFEQRSYSRILFDLTPEQLEEIGLVDGMMFGFVSPAITYDGRDEALSPRSGGFATLRFESGFFFSGGSGAYLKVSPELRGYVPIGPRVVLAARARFGTNLLSDPIPISQRYFGGGAESQRGFGRRRLSPQVPSTEGGTLPVGGEASFESSIEVRVDLFKIFGQTLGAATFVDAGDVVLHLSDLDFGNLHYAVGPGVRLTTPVGVIRLDVGFRLNRRGPTDPDPNSLYAISFSLGEAF